MATTGELVTTAYTDVLDIGADAADSLNHRSRIMLHLRRAVQYMWTYRAWPWTFSASGACSAAAGASSMIVPVDFGSFGPYTKLWRLQSSGTPDPAHIHYRQPVIVRNRLQAYATAEADRPAMWSFEGQSKILEPAAPTVTVLGTPGITPYSYKIVALRADGTHTAVSPAGSTTTGSAVLSGINFNRITWTAVTGAATYDVYRTTGGTNPPERIATGLTTLLFNDIVDDLGGPDSPPSSNNTFAKLIIFAPKLSLDTDFVLVDYRLKMPVLVDEYIIDPDDAVGGEGDSLKMIPEPYHESVLLPYLRARLMGDEGDDREPVADQEFRLMLRDAWAEEASENLQAGMLPPSYFGHGSQEE